VPKADSAAPDAAVATPAAARPASLSALFLAFSRLSLMGFGGVLPVAQRVLVERLTWLTAAEFAELLSVGQVLPGPNVINLSLMIGDRYFGWRGAVVAMFGMVALPMALVLMLTVLYQHWAEVPAVAGAVRGMGIAASGMIIATALKLLPNFSMHPLPRGLWVPIALATGWVVGAWRWPLWAVIVVGGSASVALVAWRLKRAASRKGAL
jgi:chromate transporter